jgi:CDP-4-dehydro-6-deoxyglucose reductase, E1
LKPKSTDSQAGNGLPKLSRSTWGEEERQAILEVIDSGQFSLGEKVSEFEKAYAQYIGSKYCVAVNSGSSANLLMVAALSLRQGVGQVIVPAVSWSTSYSPFQQYGWELKFVDVDLQTLNFDIQKLTTIFQPDDLILAVNILGNPNAFREFPSMVVLEDNCESMGAEYAAIRTGNFGLMSSHSTYFSHHISTMEGGLITTDDEFFYEMLLCLRSHGWTRHLPAVNFHGVAPSAFEFIYPGYNVRPTEIQAAVGIRQLEKLPSFLEQRRRNAESFLELASSKPWIVQTTPEWGRSSWFGFSIILETPEDRAALEVRFREKGIEYRPIVSGNFLRSPSIAFYHTRQTNESFPNADRIQDCGLYIGNSHEPIDWRFL